jgi:hypothetical protein
MKKLLTLLLLFVCCFCQAQTNLVLNPSFEDTLMCPDHNSQIARCKYWCNPWEFSTPDYFNSCDIGSLAVGVPLNEVGFEIPKTGNAYAGVVTSKENINYVKFNWREYIEGQLSSPLLAGIKYDVEFWVSAYDSAEWVSNDIGCFFSKTFIKDTCNICVMPYTPQIDNDTSNHLYNINGWKKVSGSFTAVGGEQYLIIGNFKDTAKTKTIYTGRGTTIFMDASAYYIDDVSVTTKDTLNGISEVKRNMAIIFPNPSSNIFNINIEHELISEITVSNVLGEIVFQEIHSPPASKIAIDLSNQINGTYFLTAKTKTKPYQIIFFKQ